MPLIAAVLAPVVVFVMILFCSIMSIMEEKMILFSSIMSIMEENRDIEAAGPAAPARAERYLATLGVVPQGAIECRYDNGVFACFGILCDAVVNGTPVTIRVREATCALESH